MPNWKKVVVSGSATSLSSLYVDTSVTASIISGSQISGSLFGTASYAISSSYSDFATTASFALNFNPQATASYALEALTASYALNAGVNTGSFATTGSNIFNGDQTISGSLTVTGSTSANVFLYPQTASNVVVPSGYNGLLVTPIQLMGTSSVEIGARLVIL